MLNLKTPPKNYLTKIAKNYAYNIYDNDVAYTLDRLAMAKFKLLMVNQTPFQNKYILKRRNLLAILTQKDYGCKDTYVIFYENKKEYTLGALSYIR